VNKLKIANEAAADIAKAGVVDIRCLEPDTARMMHFAVRVFQLQSLQGGDGTAKAVERYDAFD
jgi:hypothetical protein